MESIGLTIHCPFESNEEELLALDEIHRVLRLSIDAEIVRDFDGVREYIEQTDGVVYLQADGYKPDPLPTAKVYRAFVYRDDGPQSLVKIIEIGKASGCVQIWSAV